MTNFSDLKKIMSFLSVSSDVGNQSLNVPDELKDRYFTNLFNLLVFTSDVTKVTDLKQLESLEALAHSSVTELCNMFCPLDLGD